MANTKSAIKGIRRISRQTAVNKTRKSRFKNAIKKMNSLMKVAKTGIIKRKNASRNISRITRKINTL